MVNYVVLVVVVEVVMVMLVVIMAMIGRWICAKRGSFMRSLVDITIFSGDGIDNDNDDDDFAAGDEHCFVMIVFYSQLARALEQV